MPDAPVGKERPHPWHRNKARQDAAPARPTPAGRAAYVELAVTSNFTFLTGASHPDELVIQAAQLGHAAAAIADTNTLAGIVRAHVAAKEVGVPLVIGCRLRLMQPDAQVLVYPTDRASYGRLCQLLTLGKRRAPKGECHLYVHDLLERQEGLLAVVMPPAVIDEAFVELVRGLRDVFDDDRLSIAMSCPYGPDDRGRLRMLADLGAHVGVPMVAVNDVLYHVPQRRELQDVLTCIRHGCTLDEAGYRLLPNAERHLKPPEEMVRLFAEHPDAVARTVEIAHRTARFNLDQLCYEYPDETCPPGMTPMEHLKALTWQGAMERYEEKARRHGGTKARRGEKDDACLPSVPPCLRAFVPEKVILQLEHEFALIDELNYAPYFLTVHDLVTYARSRGILCQGRGAAANSAVCYCLGITSVDPDRIDLLFERFVSKERNEPPDIDIDFEHERREEVIQYIYRKYGRDRAALCAEVVTYRGRSAVRDVGKALGLSLDCVDRLARDMTWWEQGRIDPRAMRQLGLDPRDPTLLRLSRLVGEILGFPRHLSQHVGGFVITRSPLSELVPIENAAMPDRTVIEWDKDDIEAMGMLKVDCLGLGILTCIHKCFDLVQSGRLAGGPEGPFGAPAKLALHTIPDDPKVYDMICAADTIGVFQIESRAQMSMLPRLRPRTFYDLVIEVAIVRPGPIQGDMVHPYLRRRNGEEKVTFADDGGVLERILGKTLGVPLFQEQAMSMAIHCAGFTPGEADQLRRAIAAWKSKEKIIYQLGQRMMDGMIQRGYNPDLARRCFDQLKGFAEYGFPESHAASFALLVYVSAWLKCHHPAAFAAALLNSQPMGFYAPAQIVRDAREHGVEVRGVDVNHSDWDCTLEERHEGQNAWALRLGMRMVRGLKEADARQIVAAVKAQGPFETVESLWRTSGVSANALRRLAAADAFNSMGLDRQHALWQVRDLRDTPAPLFDNPSCLLASVPACLPPVSPPHKVMHDYHTTGLSLKAHPVSFLRPQLDHLGVTPATELRDENAWPNGKPIVVAGLVLIRQRPGTASGIVFMTIEDETGIVNLIVRPRVFDRYRQAAHHGVVILARGHVERASGVVHVMTRSIHNVEHGELTHRSRDFH